MKLRLSELRRVIREIIEEETWMPGRWMGFVNDPLDVEELEMLGSQGYIEEDLEDENDQN
jgi:hypothetical protein